MGMGMWGVCVYCEWGGGEIKLMIFIELDLIITGDRSAFNHVLVDYCALQARSRQSH
jgi:hypothetical protein